MLQSAIFLEKPEEILARVFHELKPRTPIPSISLRFCKFANANSSVRWDESGLEFRITDVLEGAPATILESLGHILISKLLRRPSPRKHAERYRRYLNRKEMRRSLELVKQTRGHKFVSGPQGNFYNLQEIFEELNRIHFHGLMAQPLLGWSRRPSHVMLGHYDPSHNVIILSRLLDCRTIPRLAVEYVLFHEMLHLQFPVEHRGARRCVHTRKFKEAEQQFPLLIEAKQLLKTLCS
ncbi:MAG: M48 family peptidase [Bryobacterales bacterium]|nr:M48 family peptidase [Bryobacterales bacterium]